MLEQIFGPVAGQRYIETVATGPDLVFELIGKHAIACDAVRTGWIQPASSEAALELLAGRAEQWRSRGAAVDLLSRAETARLLGSERYWGAWSIDAAERATARLRARPCTCRVGGRRSHLLPHTGARARARGCAVANPYSERQSLGRAGDPGNRSLQWWAQRSAAPQRRRRSLIAGGNAGRAGGAAQNDPSRATGGLGHVPSVEIFQNGCGRSIHHGNSGDVR